MRQILFKQYNYFMFKKQKNYLDTSQLYNFFGKFD